MNSRIYFLAYVISSFLIYLMLIFFLRTSVFYEKDGSEGLRQYLMFPTATTMLYADSQLTTPLKDMLDRGVLVSMREKSEGVVAVNLENTVAYTDFRTLRYLPEKDKDIQLKKWENATSGMGLYSSVAAELKSVHNGLTNVTLTFADGDRVRSFTYDYVTNGSEIISSTPILVKSGLDFILPFMLVLVGIALLASYLVAFWVVITGKARR